MALHSLLAQTIGLTASETMAELMCAICIAPLHDDIEDDTQSLECGHVFHTYCLTTYCRSAAQTIETIPCPECKLTAADMSQRRTGIIPPASPRADAPMTPTGMPPNAQLSPEHPSHIESSPPNAQMSPEHTAPLGSAELERQLDELFESAESESFFTAGELAMNDQDSARRSHPEDLALLASRHEHRTPSLAREIASAHASASPGLSQASTATTPLASYPITDVQAASCPQFDDPAVFCGTCGSEVNHRIARCYGNKTGRVAMQQMLREDHQSAARIRAVAPSELVRHPGSNAT